MTDNEIIKALECCSEVDGWCLPENRAKCPLYGYNGEDYFCDKHLSKSALAIINRQKAEIERLKPFEEKIAEYNSSIRVEDMLVFASSLEEWLEFCDNLKAEAYKEFTERLKNHFWSKADCDVLIRGVIDKSLTELTERKEDK